MIPLPPTSTLFPYTTLFRSGRDGQGDPRRLVPHRRRRCNRRRAVPVDLGPQEGRHHLGGRERVVDRGRGLPVLAPGGGRGDRKSTRLNSSHTVISYAVFCLK